MAYVIGSQKGKDKANEMKAGEEWYNTADGSTWKKNNDGSVSVTHNGQTFENAYKPSSGGSSSKNSQYSAPTLGSTWNAGTDYQAIINNAVKNGDYQTAAQAEQLRNQKIKATGGNYNTTNMYSGYLDIDYGTLGQQQMANGASWRDVMDTYNSRYNKAMGSENLKQYADDPIQQMMMNYIMDKMPKENQQDAIDQYNGWVEDYEQNNPKAEYEGKYDAKIDALLKEILNRDDFSYDARNDPLYQQYAEMYRREGDRAMKETMAEAAAGAGGMNTYAITAAQQANSYYNSQLNDKIPELYQLAYEMYLQDKESKVQDLGILQNMDATQYGRYRDTITDWYNDKNFAYGAYQDAVDQGNWETNLAYNDMWANKNFNYNDYWANKEFDYNDEWKNKEWDEGIADKEYDRDLYDQESAKEEAWKYIEMGVMPSAELLEKAGMDEATASELVEQAKIKYGLSSAVVYSGGGSSSSGGKSSSKKSSSKNSSSGGGDDESGYEPEGGKGEPTTDAGAVSKGMTDLGLGLVFSPAILVELERVGAVTESNGKLSWNTGWNANNWQSKLREAQKINPFISWNI